MRVCHLLDKPRSIFTPCKISLKLLLFSLQTLIWLLSSDICFELYSKQNHWLIKRDLYLKCSALCPIVFVRKLQMLGFVPPSSVRVHKRRLRELFLFLYVFVATSPCLVLCPPTQNGAILSPSVPEMKYKPLKCILILPCRLRLKNKHAHACTHTQTHTHTHTHTLTKEALWCQPLLSLRRRLHACGRWLLLCFACRHIKQKPWLRPRLV